MNTVGLRPDRDEELHLPWTSAMTWSLRVVAVVGMIILGVLGFGRGEPAARLLFWILPVVIVSLEIAGRIIVGLRQRAFTEGAELPARIVNKKVTARGGIHKLAVEFERSGKAVTMWSAVSCQRYYQVQIGDAISIRFREGLIPLWVPADEKPE